MSNKFNSIIEEFLKSTTLTPPVFKGDRTAPSNDYIKPIKPDKSILPDRFEKVSMENLPDVITTFKDGVSLTVQVKDKKPHGFGEIIYPNGNKFYGEFVNGKKEGKAIWISEKSGFTYEGQYKDNLKHGIGTIYYDDGTIIHGNFVSDKLNGHCTYFYKSGSVYDGWLEDNTKINGSYFWSDNDVYKGIFTDDDSERKGVFFFKNGNIYDGEMQGGYEVIGNGTYFYTDGIIEKGNFNFSNLVSGVRYLTNGDILEINDKKTTIFYANGNVYRGTVKNNLAHGKGTLYYSNGNTYYGDFKNGNADGEGILIIKSGSAYKGEFKDNQFYGAGTFCLDASQTIVGEFDSGKIHGKIAYYIDDELSYTADCYYGSVVQKYPAEEN